MSAFEYVIGAVLIVFSLIIIFVVLLQEGRQANIGVISGAADSFMEKGAAKTLDQKLAKWTKVIAIAFFVLVLAGMLLTNLIDNDTIFSNEEIAASNNAATESTQSTTATETDAADENNINDGVLDFGEDEK